MTKSLTKIIYGVVAASLILSLTPTSTQAATAQKTVLGTGPYTPNQNVDVQIRFTKPNIPTSHSIELAIAVDTSGSMADVISSVRTKLNNFVSSLSAYPGAVRISIKRIGVGSASQAGTANFEPRVITTAADRTALTSAINAIATGSSGGYVSDVGGGMQLAANTFTSLPNKGRYLIVITDGLANVGTCPITGSGTRAVTLPSGTATQVIGDPAPESYTSGGVVRGRWGTIASNTTNPPGACRPFLISSHVRAEQVYQDYKPNLMSWQMVNEIARVYGVPSTQQPFTSPNGDERISGSTNYNDINITLNDVLAKAQISDIVITDQINTAVFSQVQSFLGIYNCTSGALLFPTTSTNVLVTGVGTTSITIRILNVAPTEYCARFRATISNNPATTDGSGGLPPINSSSPGNNITYYNDWGIDLAIDDIAEGQIQIQAPNLTISNFMLTNATSGSSKQVFDVNENIYASFRTGNASTISAPSGVRGQFYRNRPAAVAAGTVGDTGLNTLHNAYAANGNYGPIESRPGGANNTRYQAPTYSWSMITPGNYTARAFINYNQAISESNYSDNQITQNYSVISQPSNLNRNVSCTAANFTWTAGSSNITGYRLIISAGGSPVQTIPVVGNLSSTSASGLTANTAYTWTLQANTANGYSATIHNGSGFTTTSCESFNTTLPAGTVVQPGGSAANQSVSLNFIPSVAAWGSNTVNIKVVAVLSGTNNCLAYNASSSAVTAGSGGASGITVNLPPYPGGRTGSVDRTASDGNPFAIQLQASAATTTGTYTICVASSSANGTANNPMVARTFEVANAGWLQIDSNSVSRNTGDVHSNGDIAFTIPASQYFFKTVAGMVSARSSNEQGLSIDTSRLAATAQWKVAAYNTTISSPAYDGLLKTVTEKMKAAPSTISASTANNASHMTTACSTASAKAYTVSGTAFTRTISTALTNANCANAQMIYFINGNLTINNNIQDDTNSSGIVFIVNGNITIGPAVTRLDAVLIFGGSFITESSSTALVINGSVIGLAGQQPTSATGNFLNGSQSGFQRNLGSGNTNPAELIRYQPKYLDILSTPLGSSTFSWVE